MVVTQREIRAVRRVVRQLPECSQFNTWLNSLAADFLGTGTQKLIT
jgi:hypothetical protein